MSRGGVRAGAGRPTKKLDSTNTATTNKNDYNFDVMKEQINLYKKLKKEDDPKTMPLRASMLKDIAPYLNKKMPTADQSEEAKEVSTIQIIDVNGNDGGIV